MDHPIQRCPLRALPKAPYAVGRYRTLAILARVLSLAALALTGCSSPEPVAVRPKPSEAVPPAILLITLDTTRADVLSLSPTSSEAVSEASAHGHARTPHLAALAARGIRFEQAHATAPMTLPSHASMLTGLAPAGHGIHENARTLSPEHPHAAERLREAGYTTTAFVSAFPLARQFGLARGFELYDDDFRRPPNAPSQEGTAHVAERRAAATTDRALDSLDKVGERPLFLWVHYFDPHEPYDPPEPFRSANPNPYLAEIEYMDSELGRLVAGFEAAFRDRPRKILVAGDHGEGLGDHGEALHGNLLYRGVIRVPLIIAGTDISPGSRPEPVSLRRIYDTLLHWAAIPERPGEERRPLLNAAPEVVLAEAMKPFLQYGWQPQVTAIAGDRKLILSGDVIELFDIREDPAEAHDLAGQRTVSREEPPRELVRAARDYPLPTPTTTADDAAPALSREAREKLASLGYAGAGEGSREVPPVREGAPSPKEMSHLFAALDSGSGLFVRQRYAEAIPIFEEVLRQDPHNRAAALRLAVAHSVEGDRDRAESFFRRAREIAPESLDLRHYEAMHRLRFGQWDAAGALFESVLAAQPDRLPALEGLARIRQREGNTAQTLRLLERIVALAPAPAESLARLGLLRMGQGDTDGAIEAFEESFRQAPDTFPAHLELGVCYLASRRYEGARNHLDRVPEGHPARPMALFKRAQVSVLLEEPDRRERVREAVDAADATTTPLIAREALFEGLR